MRGKIAEF